MAEMSGNLLSIPECFSLSPEFRLLAACSWIAPAALEQVQTEKITSLCNEEIDWDTFISLVRRHGVTSLAYAALGRHAGDKIPYEAIERLRTRNSHGRRQALFQAAELIRLIKLFTGQGIDVIPLKGVFLSHLLYGDLGMRFSVDLDILVKPAQVEQAEQILLAEGYFCDYHGLALSARQKQHVRTHIHHYDFVHAKSGLHVELHWNFGSWLPVQVSTLLNHTTQQKWQGNSVTCLDDDALLLMLCDHGARHEWCNLKWLGDVARLLADEQKIKWERLVALANQVDLQRMLAHSALLVHWIYDIPLPPEVHKLIQQEKMAASLSERALVFMQMSAKELASAGKRAQRLRAAWQMKRLRPSLPYGVVLKSALIPLDDFQVLPLPASLFWLYYPLRPVLWFWRNYIKS
jgi:hypothetical protein